MARKLSLEKKPSVLIESTKSNNYVNINNYVNVKVEKLNLHKINKSPINSLSRLKSTSIDDENIWTNEEISNPQLNYYDLDFRKNKYKQKIKLFSAVKVPKTKPSSLFNYSKKYIFKSRYFKSGITDSTNNHPAIIYADLIMHHCSTVDKIKESPKRKFELKNHLHNYLEIDFQKTKALEETDKEFKEVKKSKQGTSEESTIQSFISLCKRFSAKIRKSKS